MDKIIYFNYAAFSVMAIMLVSAFFRKIGKGLGNKAFILVVSEAFLTTVMDIRAVYFDNAGTGNIAGKYSFIPAICCSTRSPACSICFI